ncbi:MAG: C4-dicarboxylate TRAP transporter substrate-binding protein [Nocardioidaceae bacterium]
MSRAMRVARRRVVPIALAALTTLGLAACGGVDSAEGEYNLRFASYNVPTAAEAVASKQWAEDVEKATDGRVTVEFFYQEALLGGDETLQGVADGRADMGYIADAYYPAELPLSNVSGVPFVTENPEAQGRAFMDLYADNEAFHDEWESQGVHVVTWAPVPPNIVAMKEPVDGLDDLEGQKIRGYGYVSEALDMAGVSAIGISQSEVYEALQRGVLDGTSGASLDIAADRDYQEVAPHFVDVGYGNYAVTANIISLQVWESMPDDIQQAITEVSEQYLDQYLASLGKLETAACDELLEAGGDVSLLEDSEVDGWKQQAGPDVKEIWADDVRSANPEADPDAFYEAYTAALEEHEKESSYRPAIERCAERQ